MTASSRYEGLLYRALNPIWARDPLSGEGAARYGGRFNPRGMPALYCSLSPLTALREANQVGDLQPTTLVAYRASIDRVFDGRDGVAVRREGLDPELLADAGWRVRPGASLPATQQFALRLVEAGWNGLLVPSFARGSTPDDLNLVLWHWGGGRLRVIDDEGRLETP